MKKRDKQIYDVESEVSALAGEEPGGFFDEQAAALLAAEFFAGQEDDEVADSVGAGDVPPPEVDNVGAGAGLLAAGEIAELLADMGQAADNLVEAVGDDGESSLTVGGSLPGDFLPSGDERQEADIRGVHERGYGIEDMAGSAALDDSESACESDEKSGGEVAADLSAEAVGDGVVDYNAIADRVYDLLLRQIRAELAGSGSVTE